MNDEKEKITPDRDFVENSNVYQFSEEIGFSSIEELRKYSYREESFWEDLVEYLDIEFFEDYEHLKKGEGKDAIWYKGGKINIASNLAEKGIAVKDVNESGRIKELTYKELDDYSDRLAHHLKNEKGIGKGDTVGICLPMNSLAVITFYAIFKLGAIATPIFTGYAPPKIRERVNISDCRIIITEEKFERNEKEIKLSDKVNESIKGLKSIEVSNISLEKEKLLLDNFQLDKIDFETCKTDSNDPCLLIFTSGTTGEPKGTIHTHSGFLAKVKKDLYFDFDIKKGDSFFWLTDPGWIMGAWAIVGVNSIGGTLVTYEGSPKIDDYGIIPNIVAEENVDVFGATPEFFRNLDYDRCQKKEFDDLKIIGSTGERLENNTWIKLKRSFGEENIPIINVSGGTEVGGHFLSPLPTDTIPVSSVGKPCLGFDVEILDEEGNSSNKGSLVINSSAPSLTNSLWKGEERYEEEYWSEFAGSWDHGDIVEKDEDGFWYVLGRRDHLITYNGYRISPQKYEGSLNSIKGLRDSLIVEHDNKLVLFLEEAGEIEKEVVKSKISQEQGKPFIPDRIVKIDDIPYNQSGKKDRNKVLRFIENESSN